MAEFDIYPKRVKSESTGFSTLIGNLYTAGTEANDHAWNVMVNDSAAAGIRSRLSKVASDLTDEYNSACSLSQALGNIVDKYDWTERNIIGVYSFKKYAGYDLGAESNVWNYIYENGKKLIGAYGPIGKGITTITDIFKGDYDWSSPKGYIDMLSNLVGITGGVASSASKGFSWQSLLGVSSEAKTFTQALKDNLIGDYNFGAAEGVAENVGVACKWAGAALTVIGEGVENFTDDENSFGRALAETVGESAVKLGEAALVGAAVGSIIPGAGTVVGAAVAVAATVVVDWGLNAATNYLFGKDFDEAVSDVVIDTVETVGKAAWEGVKTVGNALGNAASSAKDTVCSWWSNTKNYFSFA